MPHAKAKGKDMENIERKLNYFRENAQRMRATRNSKNKGCSSVLRGIQERSQERHGRTGKRHGL
jgi:hypothetical protein